MTNQLHDDTTQWSLDDVKAFAQKAHESVVNPDGTVGQRRKYTGEPYIAHPIEVYDIICQTPRSTIEMMAAALLHDTVEDTSVTLEDIEARFGLIVATLVCWLTDVSGPEHGDRDARKQRDRERLAAAPGEVHTLKLADLISNTSTIVDHDPKFARRYLEEKVALLEILTRGDQELFERARQICNDGQWKIRQKFGSRA